eukprot:5377822-Amphidinium_carterae.1
MTSPKPHDEFRGRCTLSDLMHVPSSEGARAWRKSSRNGGCRLEQASNRARDYSRNAFSGPATSGNPSTGGSPMEPNAQGKNRDLGRLLLVTKYKGQSSSTWGVVRLGWSHAP